MVDAVLFGLIILMVSILVFQQFGGALNRERDLESSEFKYEAVHDIQKVALDTIISETGYVNLSESQPKRMRLINITVERAIKDYLYLDNLEQNKEKLEYDLSDLEKDIEQVYEKCAWDVSQYRFALESSYESSELFITNVEELDKEDLPPKRAASTTTLIIEGDRVDSTLFIWR